MIGPHVIAAATHPDPGVELVTFIVAGAPFHSSRMSVDPGAETPEDIHDEWEIWLVASGSGTLFYGGRGITVGAGDAVRFQPKERHRVVNDGAIPLVIFSVWW
jgi:mannose-6-phosphate isomerase-like protein (cupin superfamily)